MNLDADEALALIAGSFARAKTAPTRIDDGGWTIERSDQQLLVYPKKAHDGLFEPLPDDWLSTWSLPETLSLRVTATALPGAGTRVSARLTRHRIGALIGAVALDVLGGIGGIPLTNTVVHSKNMVALRHNRRAAKRRLLRLALEPLLPHQRAGERGPFRE